jgi:hypothetical protein
VTIGVFDGVHRGHQATIGHSVRRAAGLGVPSVVVTFDPHPAEVVRPGSHPAVLTEPGRKAELIEALGVDVLCVIPFTMDFSRLSAETFVHDVLVEHLHASAVVVGQNFRFGHGAAGDVALLERSRVRHWWSHRRRARRRPRRSFPRRIYVPVSMPVMSSRPRARSVDHTGWRASSCAATHGVTPSAFPRRTC